MIVFGCSPVDLQLDTCGLRPSPKKHRYNRAAHQTLISFIFVLRFCRQENLWVMSQRALSSSSYTACAQTAHDFQTAFQPLCSTSFTLHMDPLPVIDPTET